MPVKRLPTCPNLDHFKYQAKDLLKAHGIRDLQTAQRLREFHPSLRNLSDAEIFNESLKLNDAQLVIAREHGFPSWASLKSNVGKPTLADNLNLPHHERIEDTPFRLAVDLLDAGDVEALHRLLHEHPGLARQQVSLPGGNYFRNPTLLEFVAENPVRRGALPANILQIAQVILEAGAKQNPFAVKETLMLVCSGRVARECNVQIPLLHLLCDYGADPNTAMPSALVHAEFDAVNALITRGAGVNLPVAAALGRLEETRRLLAGAGGEDCHRALALASQFGHAEIVRLLLDAGEDPNRYNPVGFHSHSTALHQAAIAGHEEVVQLLVQYGAKLDIRDTLWQATPADWAQHEGRAGIVKYLRATATSAPEQS